MRSVKFIATKLDLFRHGVGLSFESGVGEDANREEGGSKVDQQHLWGKKERQRATGLVLGLYTGFMIWWFVNRKKNQGGDK